MRQIALILSTIFLNYATCRTARQFREFPDAAGRLTQAEYPSYNIQAPDGPGTYAFGYEIEDAATGNVQFRDEERLKNGTVRGSYGVLLPDNTLHITRYIADQFGYRAKTESRKKPVNTPLKIELQLQPTVTPRPGVISAITQINGQEIPVTSTPLSISPSLPNLDPNVLPHLHQNQQQLEINQPYSYLRDPNVNDPYGYLNHLYYTPQNLVYGLRQNPFDNSVSTYSTPVQPWNPFTWFNNNNQNNNNNNALYQDQLPQQPQRPVIDFLNNIATNNPLTNFFNSFGSQSDQLTNQNGFQQFFNNINPFNLFNNNNNNNRPQSVIASLPITQGDYVQPSSTISTASMNIPVQQQQLQGGLMQQPAGQIGLMQQPAGQIDSSVFSNDHFHNPNNFYQQTANPQSYYPTVNSANSHRPYMINSQMYPQYNHNLNRPYSANDNLNNNNHYPNPYNYYNPYQYNSQSNYNKKTSHKTKKHKKNKNKVDVPDSDSDWFQDFLDKRKETSMDVTSRHSSKKHNDDDEYDVDLDDYFR